VPLGEGDFLRTKALKRGAQVFLDPLSKSRYLTAIDLSSAKTVAGTHRFAA